MECHYKPVHHLLKTSILRLIKQLELLDHLDLSGAIPLSNLHLQDLL